ncbi:universal stress protein [Mucilaginibacter terrae]|uniref:Nucleotide-binding universal stress UspA family protein n=1 Tax=Mucilaginibacter terrae TaxID=1955052 RepID=A0ABU3GXB5_9SPHI|nr:universal stress protein [Mucilaginibacter terrae]MDT3404408.1 nucleotide-binding universal stress UspA family protein [Mucilaginibacter terrae]
METNRILIGVDESKYADHAAAYGFSLARKLNAAVAIVNIIEPVIAPVSPMTDTTFGLTFEGTADVTALDMVSAQNQSADSLLHRITQKYGEGLEVTQYTDHGAAADAIIGCAAQFNASMIIVGTHHRSGFDRLLMGSVAEEVVRNSEIPVLVVPLKDDKNEE